jgi:hypothetical protein
MESKMEEPVMQAGLLMEAAHAQQSLVQELLQKLEARTRGLDEVVREEIRRTLVDELALLGEDTRAAAEALRGLRRAASWRVLLAGLGVSLLAWAAPLVALSWLVPSRAEIERLRGEREQLRAGIAQLAAQGGRVDLKRCGAARFCVRVDRAAPVYGESADYFVVKGY